MRTSTAPLKDETAVAKGAKWVEPRLVAEIEFRSRTGGGLIRHATFREIVEGADPAKVVRGRGAATKAPAEAAPPVKLTNPGRLQWPEQGITKQGLADFYTEIADWILPHIADRPLSLVRCPGGVQEQCFFQKHKWAGLGDAVRLVKVPDEKEPMLALDNLAGLLELVQASVLEIHPWGAKADRPELPDRVTIDLDPGDNVPWQQVIDAALEVRTRLAGSRAAELREDHRRQGPACRVPADAEGRLGHRQALRAVHRRADGGGRAAALHREHGEEGPRRAHLRRLPAQRHGRDGDRGLFDARACRRRGVDAAGLGRARPRHPRQPFHRREPAQAPALPGPRPVGRIRVAAPGAAGSAQRDAHGPGKRASRKRASRKRRP